MEGYFFDHTGFFDSGAATGFLDFDLVQSLGFKPVPLEEPIGICTLDGTPLKRGSVRFRMPGLVNWRYAL